MVRGIGIFGPFVEGLRWRLRCTGSTGMCWWWGRSDVPRAYYNEIDGKAAAWLRELIADGLIPEADEVGSGESDEGEGRGKRAA